MKRPGSDVATSEKPGKMIERRVELLPSPMTAPALIEVERPEDRPAIDRAEEAFEHARRDAILYADVVLV